MRVVSWTVVFGAVSALVYTGFKPFWKDLELPEMAAEQVRGTVVAPRPDPKRVEKRRENGNETDPVKSACEAGADGRSEADCANTPR